MKELFDIVSRQCSETVTNAYSTSFSSATKMLSPTIRQDIYNIYGFVRFADEIVDSFHDFNKEELLNLFELDLKKSIKEISLIILIFLTGCSSTTFVYNRIDFLLPWYLASYVDLSRDQKQYLDELLIPFFSWHRHEELPRYAEIINSVEEILDSEVKVITDDNNFFDTKFETETKGDGKGDIKGYGKQPFGKK